MIVPTRELVDRARRGGGAVAALNVITLEHAEAVVAAAAAREMGVILQISENAVRYHGGALEPIAVASAAVARSAHTPVALHLDHVTDDELLAEGCASVFSSVMYDAGALPYEANVERTRAAVTLAHGAGLWVEAELGYVGGKTGVAASAHAPGVRTDADEAAAFVTATDVDALAVAVGSSHAMTERTARLDVDLVAALRDRLAVPLVLHGSSGVPDDDLQRAVAAGIAKVNVGTALNVAMTHEVRAWLRANPEQTDPRLYLSGARDAMTAAVDRLLTMLASAEVSARPA
ncbi:MAG: ketose-bisphosphate aldolase [Actinomycetales bacterium]